MNTVISNEFETKLGRIRSWIESNRYVLPTNYETKIQSTAAHKITLETFELSPDWIPFHMSFESSYCWRWFIEKLNNGIENVVIYCQLINPSNDAEHSADTGESLEAILIEDKNHQLHIGTEDSRAMYSRVFNNNCMPDRFREKLYLEEELCITSWVEYIDFGFKTTIPPLKKGERIYFHYLLATNPIKYSLEHPSEYDVSTWFAVEQSKHLIDKYLLNSS